MLAVFNVLQMRSKFSFSAFVKNLSIFGAFLTKSFLPSTLSSKILKGLDSTRVCDNSES
jgi:hypothetical protein